MPSARAALPARTWAVILIAVFAFTTLVAPATESDAGRRHRYSFKGAERCMMKKINKRRVNHGVRRLRWDRQLGYVARKHARRMARRSAIFHDSDLGSKITRWRSLAQNVGVGSGCRRLFRAFWKSSPHRANILGHYRYVGVGSERRNGRIFVQHVFEWRRDPGNVYAYP
ncbi:MAG: CAP domain-containing protein [Actinomycetota bacterium]|nr:CAP domain-containing protein [Actinomycetota bacterium]